MVPGFVKGRSCQHFADFDFRLFLEHRLPIHSSYGAPDRIAVREIRHPGGNDFAKDRTLSAPRPRSPALRIEV
jgi:hypothetical protein